ncbi:ABC transporter permease [Streptosporangium canum]|uniref:ABC transporter permease n=1 Tax=Streptosporangium canum TaxID=324952 RepID=UPI0036B7F7DF
MTTIPTARRVNISPSVGRYLRAFHTLRGAVSAIVIVLLIVLSFLAPVLYPDGFDVQGPDALLPMSGGHLFGTDELGRDIFVRTLYGLRTDFQLIFFAVPISMVIGTLLGLIGAVWAWAGSFVQRVMDIIIGFPGIILAISVVVVFGPGWLSLMVSVVVIGLPGFARLARSALLAQQHREYVLAARTLGVGRWKVLVRHIVPNAMDPLIVHAAVFLVHAIFIEAGLSLIGLGIQPPEPSLGALLNLGMRYVHQSPTYVLGPTLVLLVLAFAFSLLADALNETVTRK